MASLTGPRMFFSFVAAEDGLVGVVWPPVHIYLFSSSPPFCESLSLIPVCHEFPPRASFSEPPRFNCLFIRPPTLFKRLFFQFTNPSSPAFFRERWALEGQSRPKRFRTGPLFPVFSDNYRRKEGGEPVSFFLVDVRNL